MLRKMRGFTIVEVLIVISVMGILASIAIVSWNGVSAGSRDTARQQDIQQWASSFDLYKSRYIVYPVAPATASVSPLVVCLGKFASTLNKCGQYNSAASGASYSDSAAEDDSIITEIKKLGDRTPLNTGPKINNALVGPIVYISKDTDTPPITLTADFVSFFENNRCPSTTNWSEVTAVSPYKNLLTGYTGPNVKLCKYQIKLTYDPNTSS